MRAFIAVELPLTVRRRIDPLLAEVQDHLAASGLRRAVRWTPSSKFHLTLRFLGETNKEQQHAVTTGLRTAVRQHQPFHLNIHNLGCFPNQRSPRVIWLGMNGALDRLAALQIDTEQIAVQAGFEPERRGFSPHLTIGRAKRGLSRTDQRRLGEAMPALDSLSKKLMAVQREDLTFEAAELVLMQSVLKPDGARYTVLERFPLHA